MIEPMKEGLLTKGRSNMAPIASLLVKTMATSRAPSTIKETTTVRVATKADILIEINTVLLITNIKTTTILAPEIVFPRTRSMNSNSKGPGLSLFPSKERVNLTKKCLFPLKIKTDFLSARIAAVGQQRKNSTRGSPDTKVAVLLVMDFSNGNKGETEDITETTTNKEINEITGEMGTRKEDTREYLRPILKYLRLTSAETTTTTGSPGTTGSTTHPLLTTNWLLRRPLATLGQRDILSELTTCL